MCIRILMAAFLMTLILPAYSQDPPASQQSSTASDWVLYAAVPSAGSMVGGERQRTQGCGKKRQHAAPLYSEQRRSQPSRGGNPQGNCGGLLG